VTRPRRGRPVSFDDHQRAVYLKHVTEGVPLADAAAAVGITRQWPTQLAKTDPQFREARQRAIEAGRQARMEQKPHGEYRYIHGGCRCTICTAAATAARAGRRATAEGAPDGSGTTADARPGGTTVISLPDRNTRPDQHLRPLAAVS
jgi:hypothetical protein